MSHASPIGSIAAGPDDSPFIAVDPVFAAVTGAAPRLARVVATDAHEGPVYVPDEDALYFTTLPRSGGVPAAGLPSVDVKRVALDGDRVPVDPDRVSTVRESANVANGMALDLEGRLLACEQGTRSQHAAITRFDRTSGTVETLVEGWGNLRLNSPNDVVVKSDGTIWFTDPRYGHLQGFRPEPLVGDYVYRLEPETGRLSVVADRFDKPNGLAFSPDERILYIGDSGANQEPGSYYSARPHHIKAFDVVEGRRLENERLFCVTAPGFPDGIKVDVEGRVYASAFSGVQVFEPSGDLIGEIRLPGAVNFTFGGPHRNVLFITADDALWAAVLSTTGPSRVRGV
jgi:gluconolactonase